VGAPILPSVNARVGEFVLAAQEYVRRAIAVELDGSVESLAFVDHYVANAGKDGEVADELLALVAPALGAYFGEVVIARIGGEWHAAAPDPFDWTIEVPGLSGSELLSFRPTAMAACALRSGEVEECDASIMPQPALAAALHEALAAAAPVDEAYFYSLTGRLETLEHAFEILVELERRNRALG
jgi:hypothetical protein